MCTTVSFESSFDCERTFDQFFAKNCQKNRIPQDLSTLTKTFHPVVQTKKVNWASWPPLDCLGRQSRACQSTLGRRWVVWPGYALDVEHFFQLFLPFAILCCGSHHLECASPNNPQHLLIVRVTFRLREKSFILVFWETLSRKYGFLGRFVARFVVLHLTP